MYVLLLFQVLISTLLTRWEFFLLAVFLYTQFARPHALPSFIKRNLAYIHFHRSLYNVVASLIQLVLNH